MRVTLEKLPGVESAVVRLNDGRATIQLKPGNTLTMATIRQSVERNGFTLREAIVQALVDIATKGNTLEVRVSRTNDTYAVAAASHTGPVLQQLKDRAGQRVLIDGTIQAAKESQGTPVMQVRGVKPSEREP